eukprot:10723716-Ditylum_brightwellii.AAC.1
MYDFSGDNFPGYVRPKHAGPNTCGPLKNDWSTVCPLNMTKEERDEQCISLQEAIWGSKTLAHLEAIKASIDPDNLLKCNYCVGNDKASLKLATTDM